MIPLSDEFVDFLRNEQGIPAKYIQQNSRIDEDISLIGEDADSFMAEYFDKFGIDHGDFNFIRHFDTEISCLLGAPACLLLFFSIKVRNVLLACNAHSSWANCLPSQGLKDIVLSWKSRSSVKIPITLAMMQHAIHDRVWRSDHLQAVAGPQIYPPSPPQPRWRFLGHLIGQKPSHTDKS